MGRMKGVLIGCEIGGEFGKGLEGYSCKGEITCSGLGLGLGWVFF